MSDTPTIDQMNYAIAKFMGFEKVTVGYAGTEEETEWQNNHIEWMHKVGIQLVGDYIVNVKENLWYGWAGVSYYTSWDWLMPVVEKLETVEMNGGRVFRTAADVKIFYQACIIEYLPDEESGDPCENEITIQTQGETKLEAVYKAVYQFITWYNQQSTTNEITS